MHAMEESCIAELQRNNIDDEVLWSGFSQVDVPPQPPVLRDQGALRKCQLQYRFQFTAF